MNWLNDWLSSWRKLILRVRNIKFKIRNIKISTSTNLNFRRCNHHQWRIELFHFLKRWNAFYRLNKSWKFWAKPLLGWWCNNQMNIKYSKYLDIRRWVFRYSEGCVQVTKGVSPYQFSKRKLKSISFINDISYELFVKHRLKLLKDGNWMKHNKWTSKKHKKAKKAKKTQESRKRAMKEQAKAEHLQFEKWLIINVRRVRRIRSSAILAHVPNTAEHWFHCILVNHSFAIH